MIVLNRVVRLSLIEKVPFKQMTQVSNLESKPYGLLGKPLEEDKSQSIGFNSL